MSRIRLSEAHICVDCDTITDDLGPCQSCASHTMFPLSSFLGTLPDPEDRAVIPHTCADNPNLPCPACERVPV